MPPAGLLALVRATSAISPSLGGYLRLYGRCRRNPTGSRANCDCPLNRRLVWEARAEPLVDLASRGGAGRSDS